MNRRSVAPLAILFFAAIAAPARAESWEHRTVDVGEVRLHCVVAGQGPLLVLLHGFPEFWYGWRRQIPALAERFTVVAPDLRGYGQSDRPPRVEDYAMRHLVADVAGLIRAFGVARAVVVGHDWGGAVAYAVAMYAPERVERLVILNAPHPGLFARVLAGDPAQARASSYIPFFLSPEAEASLSAGDFRLLTTMLRTTSNPGSFDDEDLKLYREAWSRPGALTAGLNYYRANIPTGIDFARAAPLHPFPRIGAPSLVIWGEKDVALTTALLAGLERQHAGPLRIERIPDATHWVQLDAADRVNRLIAEFAKR